MSLVKSIAYVLHNKYLFNKPNMVIKAIIYNSDIKNLHNIKKNPSAGVFFNNNKNIYKIYSDIMNKKNQ